MVCPSRPTNPADGTIQRFRRKNILTFFCSTPAESATKECSLAYRRKIGVGCPPPKAYLTPKSSPQTARSNGGTLCVRVFLADDADEASTFYETIEKTSELHPDLIILDLNLPDRNHIAHSEAKRLLNGAKVLAITLSTDDLTEELLASVGAVRLLDKKELANELIPTILELAPEMQPR